MSQDRQAYECTKHRSGAYKILRIGRRSPESPLMVSTFDDTLAGMWTATIILPLSSKALALMYFEQGNLPELS